MQYSIDTFLNIFYFFKLFILITAQCNCLTQKVNIKKNKIIYIYLRNYD